MRRPGHQLVVYLAALLLPWALAQATGDSAAALLAQMPKCGLECLIDAVSRSPCSPTNTTCVCTNQAINAYTATCVAANCTVLDSLSTKNVSNTICAVPIVDHSADLDRTSITLAVISNALVLLRLAYKLYARQDLCSDDYLIVAVIVAGIPSVVITAQGTIKNGLGRDVWTLTATQITNFIFFFYLMEILYFLQLTLLKLTLLFFFRRIFPGPGVKRILWATIAFTIAFGAVFVFVAIFQCSPISFYWTNWDGLHQGRCLNVNVIGWANAVISIVLDAWMLAVPLWQIKDLRMNWKKKTGVTIMFCVGTFVTVVSIIRLQTLVSFASSANPTQDNVMVTLWSTIEINVGIFCACMPILRVILVRYVPVLGSTNNSQNYGTGTGSKQMGSSQGRGLGRGSRIPLGDSPNPGSKNILYQQTYTVQYSDETSLVRMRDMGRSE